MGCRGERIAADYLTRKGFCIRDRNWRAGRYELDIVAGCGNELHFIEVKTRRADSLTPPEMAITPAKCRALRKAAEAYMMQFHAASEPRFDVVAVDIAPDGSAGVRFIPDAFEAHW